MGCVGWEEWRNLLFDQVSVRVTSPESVSKVVSLLVPQFAENVVADYREQRVAVKFYFLLKKSAAETIVVLKTAY